MLEFRLKALETFLEKPMPTWGGDLSGMDYDEIYYYIRPMENLGRSWDDVPDDIKNTFERLGIPEAGAESPGRRGRAVRVRGGLPLAEEGVGRAGRHLRG